MTAQTLTLTEFLLARIAEAWCDCDTPARVEADREAKRRIVNDWQSLADRVDEGGRPLHLFDPATSMLLKATEPWLRALAAVYADHPDYRAEWKP